VRLARGDGVRNRRTLVVEKQVVAAERELDTHDEKQLVFSSLSLVNVSESQQLLHHFTVVLSGAKIAFATTERAH